MTTKRLQGQSLKLPMHLQGQSLKVELSVVIVNYNAAPFLRETLTSLQKQQGVSFEVIIVDNGSHDDSRQVARAVMPEAVWIPQKTNLGFSRANNEGIRKATGPVILFLNPDVTFPESDTLQKCLTRLKKNPKIGILTPRVDLVTGGIDMTCHRGFPTPWASFTHFTGLEKIFPHVPFFNEYTKRYLGYETEHEIDAVGGMCMFVPRGVGEELGWWDEDFPFYGEDLDLCFRAHARSYTVWYYPETSVLHHKGVTSGMGKRTRALTTASKATKRQAKIWSVQAMQLFYDKHYRGKYPRLVTLLVHLGIKIMYVIRVGL